MGVFVSQVLYGERSWNPLAQTVELTEDLLRRGGRVTPLGELNLAAMADAYLRGRWLGGGGTERPLDSLAEAAGNVPVTRVTGTATPVKARRAAEFARALGQLAVRGCGGPSRWPRWRHGPGPRAYRCGWRGDPCRGPPDRSPSPWTAAWYAWTCGARTPPPYGYGPRAASGATPPVRARAST